MPQFTAHRNPNRATRATIPLLLDVQHDLLRDLGTRVVIPLYKPTTVEGGVVERLMLRVRIAGHDYIAVTSELAGVRRKSLGTRVADLSHQRDDIIAALDFLITGI